MIYDKLKKNIITGNSYSLKIIKNKKKIISFENSINDKVINDILNLYLLETNTKLNLDNQYKLNICKNKKTFANISSFDFDKLEKLVKLLNYNFLK